MIKDLLNKFNFNLINKIIIKEYDLSYNLINNF